MAEININKQDISTTNVFRKYDKDYTKIWGDDDRHLYVFQVFKKYPSGIEVTDYEVVKGIKYKNPDGSIVYVYPSAERFGSYGYYIQGQVKSYAYERIVKRLKDLSPDVDLSNFKLQDLYS